METLVLKQKKSREKVMCLSKNEKQYYKQEESKNFINWTRSRLEFLLKEKKDILTRSQIEKIEKILDI